MPRTGYQFRPTLTSEAESLGPFPLWRESLYESASIVSTPMLATYARTDVGLKRTNNEDAYLADPSRGLVVVADGMGGHAAGEVASQLAVESIAEMLPTRDGFWPFGRAERERNFILGAIRTANERIRTAASRDPALRGMGTTVVVLWVKSTRGHVAHVGDSRLYRFRGGRLEALTEDHSLAATDGARRNVLTRAVGVEPTVEIDYRLLDVSPGDVFLLCSDGLTRTVDDSTIVATLAAAAAGEQASHRLIELAREKGAPDNVTVALAYA
jgi:PPM family protein phosphatase